VLPPSGHLVVRIRTDARLDLALSFGEAGVAIGQELVRAYHVVDVFNGDEGKFML